MDYKLKKSNNLKQVIFYNTIGVVVCIICFVFMKFTDIAFFENYLDLRYFGIIFLCSMVGYTIPK